jgi:hypothetical protein
MHSVKQEEKRKKEKENERRKKDIKANVRK